MPLPLVSLSFFFFNDTATTEIYTLSLHDALPIWRGIGVIVVVIAVVLVLIAVVVLSGLLNPPTTQKITILSAGATDRKSTRLNSSHLVISYAVFCLKKKNYANRAATPCRLPPPRA